MPRILLCALATQSSTIAGSTFNHKCAWCDRRVMISPSGQRRLVEFSDIKITCTECCKTIPDDGDSVQLAAEGEEELAQEFRNVIPNLWRQRN